MEDAALEENPADDQPSDEEPCEVPAHQSSSVGEGAEPPVSGPSASPAVGLDHSPRPRGFGRHPHWHHGAEHRQQKWRQRREGQRKTKQCTPVVSREPEMPVPLLADADQESIPQLHLLLLPTGQTAQCLASQRLGVRRST